MRKLLGTLAFVLLLPTFAFAEPWINVKYDPANFFAAGAMTWKVKEAYVSSYNYKLLDPHTMLINFAIKESSVGGRPSPELRLKIPGGYHAGSQALTTMTYYDHWDGHSYDQRVGTVGASIPGADYLQIRKLDSSNWTLSNSTYILGQIIIELCAEGAVCTYKAVK